jgi:hypothetical protein
LGFEGEDAAEEFWKESSACSFGGGLEQQLHREQIAEHSSEAKARNKLLTRTRDTASDRRWGSARGSRGSCSRQQPQQAAVAVAAAAAAGSSCLLKCNRFAELAAEDDGEEFKLNNGKGKATAKHECEQHSKAEDEQDFELRWQQLKDEEACVLHDLRLGAEYAKVLQPSSMMVAVTAQLQRRPLELREALSLCAACAGGVPLA